MNGHPTRDPDLAGRRILVVEDDYFLASDVCRALEKLGAQVIGPIPDLARALAAARSEDLDGAVLDVNLREEYSGPVAEELSRRGLPFVIASGYDDPLPPAMKNAAYLRKPFNMKELIALLCDLWPDGRAK